MKSQRVAAKTALLAPVGTVQAWGIQQLISGDPVAGAIATTISIAMVAVFVAIQEYDIPYEDEIVAAVGSSDAEQTADTITEASERAAGEIEDLEGK